MTFDEILTANGIDGDVAAKLKAAMRENKQFIAGEENLDIRYGKLKGDFDSASSQLSEAQKLIAEMKKSEGDNTALQGKIQEYEAKIAQLEAEKAQIEADSALRVALLEAGAEDIDYLSFKVKEKGEVRIGKDGKIAGMDDTIAALKTQFPAQFRGVGAKKVEENKLEKPDDGGAITPEEFKKMGYAARVKLYNDDPETYQQLTGNN